MLSTLLRRSDRITADVPSTPVRFTLLRVAGQALNHPGDILRNLGFAEIG